MLLSGAWRKKKIASTISVPCFLITLNSQPTLCAIALPNQEMSIRLSLVQPKLLKSAIL